MAESIPAPTTGSVWRLLIRPGQTVVAGEEIAILESMKMEVPVESPRAGTIVIVPVAEGQAVEAGEAIAEID